MRVCVAEVLFTNGEEKFGYKAACAAAACIVQFDTYCRPNEIVKLRACDLLRPPRGSQKWALLIGTSDASKEGDAVDQQAADDGTQRRTGTKTRQFDNVVVLGEVESTAAGRGCVNFGAAH